MYSTSQRVPIALSAFAWLIGLSTSALAISSPAESGNIDATHYYTGPGGGGGASNGDGGPFGSGGPGYYGGGENRPNGDSSGAFGFPGGAEGVGFDIQQAIDYRRIHGILAAAAMVLLFPVGSILLRILPGRFAVWVHAVFQMLAWCVYVAAAALGVYLVQMVKIPGSSLFQNPSTRYHPIIGLVLLALLIIQPFVGFIHHRVYKRVERRQGWSYTHLFIGRVGITLGIVNGGLGLYLANASTYDKKVYTIVAAIMWALWMVVALWAEIRRLRQARRSGHKTVVKEQTRVVDGRIRE